MRVDGTMATALALALSGAACGPKVGVSDTETTGEDASVGDDVSPDSEGDGDGDDVMLDGDGDGDGDDGGTIEGGSCAGLDPDGPTVGGGEPGPSGFPPPCSPRADADPSGVYTCCSDDPAAQGGALPAFMGKNVPDGGLPWFSGVNNAIGSSGLCVKTREIPAGSGLLEPQAANCPVPCDPTWSDASVATVCGAGQSCCQTQEIQAADCIIDPRTGLYRPVDGTDIGTSYENGVVVTTWAPGEHATHQDPSGPGCLQLAGDDLASELFRDCVRNLHVAHRRGVCMALARGQLCPLVAQPNACDLLNDG